MSVYFDALRTHIDIVVPGTITHIGVVLFDYGGYVNLRVPQNGKGMALPRVKRFDGETPSQTVNRVFGQHIGGTARTLYPLPYQWPTSNSSTFFFTGVTKPGDVRGPSKYWRTVDEAYNYIKQQANGASGARDIAALRESVKLNPCSYRRILHMVRELHLMGYQRLRAFFHCPSNAWELAIVPKHWILHDNGGMVSDAVFDFPLRNVLEGYSSETHQKPFGWEDAAFYTPHELATRYLHSFPDIRAAGWGKDQEYVDWFERMLLVLEPFGLPYAVSFNDMTLPRDRIYVQYHPYVTQYHLPPGGDADGSNLRYLRAT